MSNFDYRYLPEILETGIIPAVDQIELHPQFQQIDTRPLLAENDIKIEPGGRWARQRRLRVDRHR